MTAIGQVDPVLVWAAHNDSPAQTRRVRPALRAVIALAAALCLVLAAVPALAAMDVEPAYDLIYRVAPGIAQGLKPVRMSCTDSGIRMEVISAQVEGSHAAVLLSLRDESGEGRVDETADLFDSYDLRQSGSFDATCAKADWDAETRTKFFLVSIDQRDAKAFRGDKFTFRMRKILSGKQEFSEVLDLDPTTASRAPDFRESYNSRGWAWEDYRPDPERYHPLAVQQVRELTEGAQLTAIGWVDGELRVQLHFDDISHTDNHGFVCLTDGAGELLESDWSFDFWDEDSMGSYTEFGFTVPENSAWFLYTELTTAHCLTQGNWQVTFRLES